MDVPPAQGGVIIMKRILQGMQPPGQAGGESADAVQSGAGLWQPVSVPSVIDDVLGMLPPDAQLRPSCCEPRVEPCGRGKERIPG